MKFLVLSILILVQNFNAIQGSYDQSIQEHILSNYKNQNFPGNSAIDMKFSVSFFGVTQVDTIQGVISVSLFLKLYWTDPLINWSPSQFGGVESISIKATQDLIWIPDVVMYENAEKPFEQLMEENSVLKVSSDGSIYWSRPGVILIKHQFDLKGYPYDIQKIYMTFGSWLYPTDRVIFTSHSGGHSLLSGHLYSNNVEWLLILLLIKYQLRGLKGLSWKDNRDEWPEGAFDSVVIELTIQRNGGIVMEFLILPSLFCGIILMNYYFLPVDSTDRLSFLLTMILSVVLLILVMFEKLPMNDQNMLAKQMFDIIVFSSFALFGWVAIIGAIYKIKYRQYKKVKLQQGLPKKSQKEKTKDKFFKELMEKFDMLLDKQSTNDNNSQTKEKQSPNMKEYKYQKIQISSISAQDDEEESNKMTNNNNLNQNSQRKSFLEDQKLEAKELIVEKQKPIPFITFMNLIKYFMGVKKITQLPIESQIPVYKKVFRLIKIIDLAVVILSFVIFTIFNFIIFIKYKIDYL